MTEFEIAQLAKEIYLNSCGKYNSYAEVVREIKKAHVIYGCSNCQTQSIEETVKETTGIQLEDVEYQQQSTSDRIDDLIRLGNKQYKKGYNEGFCKATALGIGSRQPMSFEETEKIIKSSEKSFKAGYEEGKEDGYKEGELKGFKKGFNESEALNGRTEPWKPHSERVNK